MLTATPVIPPEQCFIFPSINQLKPADRYSKPVYYLIRLSTEPPQDCILQTYIVRSAETKTFRYCETRLLPRGHRLSLFRARWLTPRILCSSNITFLMHTNTCAWGECVAGGHEWQLRMPEKVGEEVGGGSVSRKVWWGSIGPPGQMAVPVGIRINPPKLFPCRGHQNAVRSPSLLLFSFCFIPPITDAHRLCSLTYWVFRGGCDVYASRCVACLCYMCRLVSEPSAKV